LWRDAVISFAGDAGEREGAEDWSAAMLERRTALDSLSPDYRAKEHLSLHADAAIVSANELVKVDAEQIHLG
jgi:hypothetical protein